MTKMRWSPEIRSAKQINANKVSHVKLLSELAAVARISGLTTDYSEISFWRFRRKEVQSQVQNTDRKNVFFLAGRVSLK